MPQQHADAITSLLSSVQATVKASRERDAALATIEGVRLLCAEDLMGLPYGDTQGVPWLRDIKHGWEMGVLAANGAITAALKPPAKDAA